MANGAYLSIAVLLAPFIPKELAAIFRRTQYKPLVQDYLSPVATQGLLVYTIPKMESHLKLPCTQRVKTRHP